MIDISQTSDVQPLSGNRSAETIAGILTTRIVADLGGQEGVSVGERVLAEWAGECLARARHSTIPDDRLLWMRETRIVLHTLGLRRRARDVSRAPGGPLLAGRASMLAAMAGGADPTGEPGAPGPALSTPATVVPPTEDATDHNS